MKLLVAAGLLSLSLLTSAESLRSTADMVSKRGGTALSRGDTKKFSVILRPYVTKDFKFTEPGQTMDFKGMVAHMKQGIGMLGHVTGANSKVLTCIEHGMSGITTATHSMTADMVGADRKVHKMVVSGTSRDSWVKVGGVWKLSHMAWGADKMTIDGKPLGSK